MLMGLDHHILMVKSFVNASSAMNYYNDIPYYGKIIKELEKTDYSILSISEVTFKNFISTKILGLWRFFYQQIFKRKLASEKIYLINLLFKNTKTCLQTITTL